MRKSENLGTQFTAVTVVFVSVGVLRVLVILIVTTLMLTLKSGILVLNTFNFDVTTIPYEVTHASSTPSIFKSS